MNQNIAVALGLSSADHPLTEDVVRRVLGVARRAPVDMPFITAALLSRQMVNVGPREAQAAIDRLVYEGHLRPVEGWGYVARTQAEAAHVLLGRTT
jgi:hypothetical protein